MHNTVVCRDDGIPIKYSRALRYHHIKCVYYMVSCNSCGIYLHWKLARNYEFYFLDYNMMYKKDYNVEPIK